MTYTQFYVNNVHLLSKLNLHLNLIWDCNSFNALFLENDSEFKF